MKVKKINCLILLVFILFACAQKSAPPQKKEEITVKTVKAELKELENRIEFSGSLSGADETVVSSETDSHIVNYYADLGDFVKKGKVLVKLNDSETIANLNQEKSRLELSKTKLKRVKTLVDEDILSKQEFDTAKSEYDVSKARFDFSAKKLSDTTVRAPFDGYIKERKIQKGQYVKAKDPLFLIVKNSPLKVEASVPEKYSSSIKTGLFVNITVETYNKRVFSGKISRVSPAVNVENRMINFEAIIPNEKKELKPGFFTKGFIVTGKAKKVVIPEEAVAVIPGVKKVFVIESGKANERVVKLGSKLNGDVEVLEGVKDGEMVAVTGLSKLENGIAVKVSGDKK